VDVATGAVTDLFPSKGPVANLAVLSGTGALLYSTPAFPSCS
jgi:hypothetical protein